MTPSQTCLPESPPTNQANPSVQTAIENMTRSLTVLYAQAQLLHRRIETGRIRAATDCLPALETIEQHAADLAQRIRQTHRDDSGRSAAVTVEPSRRIA